MHDRPSGFESVGSGFIVNLAEHSHAKGGNMSLRHARLALAAVVAVALAGTTFGADSPGASLKMGTPDIKSAGPLAFGPDGILFVGDTTGAAVFAIDTGDRTPAAKAPINIKDVAKQVAARLGTDA